MYSSVATPCSNGVQSRFYIDDYSIDIRSIPSQRGLASVSRSTDRLTGDWTGLFHRKPGSFRLVLADLEGKGAGASEYHDYIERHLRLSPSSSAAESLASLHDNWTGERFAAVEILDVDTLHHQFTLALAGQPDPIIKLPYGDVRPLPCYRFGLVGVHLVPHAGRLPRFAFPENEWLVLVSDGVLDAGMEQGNRFGLQRLLQAIQAARSPASVLDGIVGRVLEHLQGRALEDDLSAVVIWRNTATEARTALHRRQAA
jgi:serine phosphatase RsbU (regulator of sigma subunit)